MLWGIKAEAPADKFTISCVKVEFIGCPLITDKEIKVTIIIHVGKAGATTPCIVVFDTSFLGNILKFPRCHLSIKPVGSILADEEEIWPTVIVDIPHGQAGTIKQVIADIFAFHVVLEIDTCFLLAQPGKTGALLFFSLKKGAEGY